MHLDITEERKTLRDPSMSTKDLDHFFVIFLDQQIIENNVHHSAWVTSCRFIFLY